MLARRLDSSVATIGVGLALVLAGSVPFFWNGTLVARWSVPERVTSVIQGTEAPAPDDPRTAGGIGQRWIGLRTAARMIGHQPWFGFGLSGYSEAMARHAAAGLDDTYYDNHIHNLYLQIWIESGVFVLAAFLAGLCVFLVQSVNGLNTVPVLVLPAVGIVVASCTHNMFDIVFVHGMQLLVGFALSAPIIVRRKRRSTLSFGPKS
jgi:O-antigen ligase